MGNRARTLDGALWYVLVGRCPSVYSFTLECLLPGVTPVAHLQVGLTGLRVSEMHTVYLSARVGAVGWAGRRGLHGGPELPTRLGCDAALFRAAAPCAR